jgi:hypothetical protein
MSSTGLIDGVKKHNCIKNYEGSSKWMEAMALTTVVIQVTQISSYLASCTMYVPIAHPTSPRGGDRGLVVYVRCTLACPHVLSSQERSDGSCTPYVPIAHRPPPRLWAVLSHLGHRIAPAPPEEYQSFPVHMLRPNLESIQIRIRMAFGCPKPNPNLDLDGKIIKLNSHKVVSKCHKPRRP